MKEERDIFWKNLLVVFTITAVLWFVFVLQKFFGFDFSAFGNRPHTLKGLTGIIFSPFIHGGFEHLVSNTLPFMVLFTVLLNGYPRVWLASLIFIHVISGILVWLFAPTRTIHIGISGIIYGMACFLIASGIFRKDRTSVSIAILVTIIYVVFGEMITGLLPKKGVSWQSHLFGSISGIVIAFILRRIDMPPLHEFYLEEHEEEKPFFEAVREGTTNSPPPHS